MLNAVPIEVLGNGEVMNALRIKNTRSSEVDTVAFDGMFVAIGHSPNTAFQLETDANGYVVTRPGTTRTSVRGVFACGDVQDSIAVTAAGSGCMAAIDAERWLAHDAHDDASVW